MKQGRYINTTCPYCNHKNASLNESWFGGLYLVVCDIEEGGCDRPYAIEVEVHQTARVFALELHFTTNEFGNKIE